jgi:hypothetical protein
VINYVVPAKQALILQIDRIVASKLNNQLHQDILSRANLTIRPLKLYIHTFLKGKLSLFFFLSNPEAIFILALATVWRKGCREEE